MDIARSGGLLVPAGTAARILGVHPRTVHRWIRRGTLQGKRVKHGRTGRWYVFRESLHAFCNESYEPEQLNIEDFYR